MVRIMSLDLTDEETAALIRLLRKAIATDHFPLSPRVQAKPDVPADLCCSYMVRAPL
jgi:hypothetical protein